MHITQTTRRDIFDALVTQKIRWSGRLEEPEFLARLFDLSSLASNDRRYTNASGDIYQHRVNNRDWNDDWVFYDPRFGLMTGDDDIFLRFLCETIHPVVRSDVTESSRLCQLYNQSLANDGFQIVEQTRLSNKPVYIGRFVGTTPTPGVAAARTTLAGLDPGYIAQQITRMETSVIDDPDLAIGTAKELVETCCKTILTERGVAFAQDADLPDLVKLTRKELALTPDDIPDRATAADTVRRLLSNLGAIAQGVAVLRNLFGTGHGKVAGTKGLEARHAKLAVGAASTLATFLVETHNLEKAKVPPALAPH